jgi:hypothetical protein
MGSLNEVKMMLLGLIHSMKNKWFFKQLKLYKKLVIGWKNE